MERSEEIYGESELNGSQSDDGYTEENGNGFSDHLGGGAHNAGLPRRHPIPTSGMQ